MKEGTYMTIPLEILKTWSKQGATHAPKALREKIENKLTGADSSIKMKNNLEIYLQGSYRNNTNIYGNSDVDVVVQHNSVFGSNTSQLSDHEKAIYKGEFSDATYTWHEFKGEVIETMQKSFGTSNLEIGNKSIKINDGSYEADVVPCFEYRKYITFGKKAEEQEYIPGIKFYTAYEERTVVNYPKEHYSKGADKNQRVNEQYKPIVRVFKNIKKKLIEKNMINKEHVSSYFIENLLYNVPDKYFNLSDLSRSVPEILEWLQDTNYLPQFLCQNEQTKLFGNNEEQWDKESARLFITQALMLWDEW